MSKLISLKKLPIGQAALIEYMQLDEKIKIRLMELGFSKGTKITTLHSSPLGDIFAYGIRGTVIGLRTCDINNIFVLWEGEV